MPRNSGPKWRLLAFVALVALLALVRLYETVLFYDPFLAYFKGEFVAKALPQFDGFRLFLSLLFRYGINAVISLAVLYVAFLDKPLLKFSGILYLFFFVLLVAAFFMVVAFAPKNALALFYIRRFLIQPLLVILFLPGFYYQKRLSKK